jgi:hypothetical protein
MHGIAKGTSKRLKVVALGAALAASSLLVLDACLSDSATTPPTADAAADVVVIQPNDAGSDVAPDVKKGFDAGGNEAISKVLINEISGGDEWVELVNSGDAGESLVGFKLADRDKTTGEPKLSEAITFPASTDLAPGAYLLVRGGGVGDAGKPCPDGGQAYCFNAVFGISNKNGETLFLLQPDGGVVGKVVYPPDASAGSMSYARIPNADPNGAFKTVAETPGAPNVE